MIIQWQRLDTTRCITCSGLVELGDWIAVKPNKKPEDTTTRVECMHCDKEIRKLAKEQEMAARREGRVLI